MKCWLPPGGRLSDLPRNVEAMGTVSQTVRVYRFGMFAVDVKTGELTNAGRRTPLREQPLQLLLALLEQPGELITREELTSRLWPDGTFVDFDRGLNKAMNHLREALSDSAEHPQFIETLPRKGYRFIAPVTQDAQDLEQAAPDVPSGRIGNPLVACSAGGRGRDDRNRNRRRRRRDPQLDCRPGGAAPHITSIAVLPLENLSDDPEQDYFADGMTDALITDLAKMGSLRMTSRTSVMRYKGAKRAIKDIGRELNVDAVVEGTVTRVG